MMNKVRDPLLVVHREFWPDKEDLAFRKGITPTGTNQVVCRDCGEHDNIRGKP